MRATLALAASALVLGAAPAAAQLPAPFGQPTRFEDAEDDKKPTKDDETPPEERVDNSKAYEVPAKVDLPEGPAKKLSGVVAVLAFDAIVSPGMGEFVIDSIDRARREGAQLLLIEMDTPGGLVSTTEKMVQAILTAPVPVVVHVTPSGAHAASAGTFVTLAAHVAAMSPATRIGAAHPVTGSGKDPEAEGGKHMAAKVENDLLALVEGIAKHRNRNVEWAKDAVKHSVSAHAERAVEIGVVDFVATDRRDLLEKLDGRQVMVAGEKVELSTQGAQTVEYEPSLRNRLLALLANPGIAMVLGILGLIGVMVEIYHPGLIVPGVMGVLAIICSLIAMEQMPIDVGAALLAVAGLGLLVAEVYTPTHGALGVLGGIGLTIGLVLLIDPSNPDFAVDPSLSLSFLDVLPLVVLMGAFVAYLSFFVVRSRRHRVTTGAEGLVGARGEVLETVGPEGGQVFVAGEYWQARATETIAKKDPVEVVKVNGLVLEVRRRGG